VARYCYGIGGGWDVTCARCRDAAIALGSGADGSVDPMAEADYFEMADDGRMTAEASARFDAAGRPGLSNENGGAQ
jgi:hypothetical protein